MINMDCIFNKITSNYSGQGAYTFVNFSSYLKIRRLGLMPYFRGVFVDGVAAVIFLRFLGLSGLQRRSFDMTSLAPIVFNEAMSRGLRVAIIGSTKDSLASFISNIVTQYPSLDIVDSRTGFFSDLPEQTDYIQLMLAKKPDVIIVGMGAALQERFVVECVNSGFSGLAFTCGGFIHQSAKKIHYYPLFFDKFNIRWLYRIIDEPYLIRRYVIEYPVGMCAMFIDWIKCKYVRPSPLPPASD